MTGPFKEDGARKAIIEQAGVWFLRHRSGELSVAEKAEFLEWLRASKLNMLEYFEQVRLHQAFTQALPEMRLDRRTLINAARDEFSVSDNIVALTNSSSGANHVLLQAVGEGRTLKASWARMALATAASLLLIVGTVWIYGILAGPQRISVSHGEQRIVQLPDGSTMHVNVNSQVEVKYSPRDRLVEIDKGQAFFEVARDPRRPFRVRAGGAEVVAVGTQFDVYRRSDKDVIVTVLQGKVDVSDSHWAGPKPGAVSNVRVRITAGEQVQVGRLGTSPVIHAADAQVATAWMRREVIFNGESLAQVTDEINRYVAVPIFIEDGRLKKMRVRAVFNAYDSESFLAFLKQYDVEVNASPTAVRVRERNPSGR